MHSNFTFPKELKGELLEKIRNFEILHHQAHDKYFPHKIFKSFTDKLTDLLQVRLKAASYLMMNVPWDVFMVYIQSSDLLQHPMWCFLDAKHSLFDKEKRDYVVATFYESLDKGIGKLTSQVMDIYPNDDVLTILLSDHGFQSHLRSVNLQNWLYQNGWLRIQKSDAQARISNKFLLLIRKVDIFELRKKILPQVQRHNLARFLGTPYDLEKSRAISLGNNSWAFIALLDKSEAFRKRLASELLSLRDKYTGNKIVRQVLRKESVYSGSKLNEIPDLIVVPCDGYTFSRGHPYEPFLRNIEPGRDYHIGTHHRDGIIVMNGPGIIQKKDVEASIIDVAPTILCYLGVPIPNDEMDGKILEDLFSSRIIEETAPAYCDFDITVKQRD
jgi:predicted AlkP superfamily phosphohydrolase/phosphomutase